MNHYFGSYFGLEWRVGAGFGAMPSATTDLGMGMSLEASMTLRPFKDDRKRIKLQLQEVAVYGFLTRNTVTSPTVGLSVAYEMPL